MTAPSLTGMTDNKPSPVLRGEPHSQPRQLSWMLHPFMEAPHAAPHQVPPATPSFGLHSSCPETCLQLSAPSLNRSGTCRAFPHRRNFPAQAAAPGQPEVPQPGAPVCRSCPRASQTLLSSTVTGQAQPQRGTEPWNGGWLTAALQLGAAHSGNP